MTYELTPWFLGAHHAPVREGRYQVRFCFGWAAVLIEFRKGRWWLPRDKFEKPQAVTLSRWPGFHWRGITPKNRGGV